MKYGNEFLRKFKIGETVRIKKDLELGRTYYSEDGKGDTFSSLMIPFRGREGRIIGITYKGYKLDIDPIHTYTEDMVEEPRDDLALSEYTFKPSVERVLIESEMLRYKMLVDKALDDKLYETNPKEFEEIVDDYTRFFDENKTLFQ